MFGAYSQIFVLLIIDVLLVPINVISQTDFYFYQFLKCNMKIGPESKRV